MCPCGPIHDTSIEETNNAPYSKYKLVTGANGYLGSHVVWQLLEKGYRVRGTVRKPDDSKNAFLRQTEFHPKASKLLELVAADLNNAECWAPCMRDVDVVFHVASPFQLDVNATEEQFVAPAVCGTKNVLQAAADASITRVVLTSSIAAISEGYKKTEYNSERVFTEKDWTVTESPYVGHYEKSKALAEKAGWEVAEKNNLGLVVINPGLIFGPVFDVSQGASSASSDMLMRFLLRKYPAIPPINMPTVDVRDVATAHVKAMELPQDRVVGNRFICVERVTPFNKIASTLNSSFKEHGFKIATASIPNSFVSIASWFYPDLKMVKSSNNIDRKSQISNEKITTTMQMEFRDMKTSLYEHAISLIKHGLVPQKKVPQEVVDGFKAY